MRRNGLSLVLAILSSSVSVETSWGAPFLKGGLILHPDLGGIEDRWFASVGGDWDVSRTVYLGVDFQATYGSTIVGGKLHTRFVPINAFFTAKWRPGHGVVNPYVGAGIGLVSAWERTEYTALGLTPRKVSTTDYEASPGYQFMAGVDFRERWLIEFLVRHSYSSAESLMVNPVGPEFSYSILTGINW